jgi:hypothetical protein
MAKAKLNPVFDEVRGSYGDLVLKEVNGNTIWAHKPKQGAELGTAQAAFKERCLRAKDYVTFVKKNPETLALYEQAAEATGKSVHRLCTSDYHNPPVVVDINAIGYKGQVGDVLKFIARDDFGVVDVLVTLSDDEKGTLIEQGYAVPEVEDTAYWMYTATQPVPAGTTVCMRVEAFDRPRNMGRQQGTKRV